MQLIPSVCTNLYFPESRKSIDAFRKTAHFLAGKGLRAMEFYHDGDGMDKVGGVLQEAGLEGVFIAVIALKERPAHLCATDPAHRAEAVALAREMLDRAAGNGIKTVMVNSGRMEPGMEAAGMEALAQSIELLYNYKIRKHLDIALELEPCDSGIDARQLVGPWRRTLALAQTLEGRGVELRLTMDSAHTAEEFEDFLSAVKGVKKYCAHVHYANCFLKDSSSPLYGDKHLGYEYPDTAWTFEALDGLTGDLDALYPDDEPLMIGLEALCLEEDRFAYFDKTWARLPFLSSRLKGKGVKPNGRP